MSTSKSNDLSTNPFVALFPNVDHAKQYIEATRKGLEESRKLIEPSSSSSAVTQIPSQDENGQEKNKQISRIVKKLLVESKEVIVNDFLQRVFLLTVNNDENNIGITHFGGVPCRCIHLCELRKELEDANTAFYLTKENLNQALLERLQMSEPVIHLCIQAGQREKNLNAVTEAREELLVKYLAMCYCRLVKECTLLQREVVKDKHFTAELSILTDNIRQLIFSYAGSILLQPEVFPTNNPHTQLFNICKETAVNQDMEEFVTRLIEKHTSPDDLKSMFGPILKFLWEQASTLKLLNPDTYCLVNIMIIFSRNTTLTWLLLKSNYWLPPSLHLDGHTRHLPVPGIAFEVQTLLGCFLRLSPVPFDFFTGVSEYFLEPSRQTEGEMAAITNNIQQQTDVIVSKVHEFLYNLVQQTDVQNEVLYWIGVCLHCNMKRFQMMVNDPNTVCHCGFFLNLTHVLLKFCEPFLSPSSKLLLKVDCRYGAAQSTMESISKPKAQLHAVAMHKLTQMVPKPDHVHPVSAGTIKFKFVTELFYLTHLCYKLGFVKTFEEYQELMKRLQKLNNVYQETRLQSAGDPMIEDLKKDFENGIRRQLSVKAHLCSPSLSDLALRFCVASSYWLIQQVLAGNDYATAKNRELKAKFITNEVPPALTAIPEFFSESIGDTIRMMGYFNEECLERCDGLQHIMEFFAVFLGDASRIKNPHLRAKLAECLAAFLPRDRFGTSNLFSFSFRKKAFDQSPVVPKILPKSLLQLFVDIEFTGHTMEFEQKFTYRHYMYEILERIWKLPAYYATFRKLYEEGKIVYKRDLNFSTFPRFINLLVNDSTFLLDEALQNLVMIKTLEKERDDKEWETLSHTDRSQKERNLQQFGHFARAYNTMAKETVHVLSYITRDIPRPFASPCMADSMAAFLNYFFVHLVGPRRKDLKVNDFKKYNFDPANLVKNITLIYLSLGNNDEFCRTIVKDTRSYSDELFQGALGLIERLEGAQEYLSEFSKLAKKLKTLHKEFKKSEEEIPEPPDEFLDPISCMLMYEPVKLPSSGQIVDKGTIAKHLLSDEKDPFNRSALRLDQVIPCDELRERIQEWMRKNNVKIPRYSAEDCAG